MRKRGGSPVDRRAIPARRAESTWIAADGHAIRRIDLAGPGGARARLAAVPAGPRRLHREVPRNRSITGRSAGWRVTALDWRGQGASGRLGGDARTGHIADFALWVDDLARVLAGVERGTRRARGCVVAHSMGGAPGAARGGRRRGSIPTRWCCRRRCSGSSGGCPRRRCTRWRAPCAAVGDERRAGVEMARRRQATRSPGGPSC